MFRLLVNKQSLNVPFAITPNLAEQDEVTTVEKTELEGVDFTFKGADAQVSRPGNICNLLAICDGYGFRQGTLFLAFASAWRCKVVSLSVGHLFLSEVTLDRNTLLFQRDIEIVGNKLAALVLPLP